MLVSGTQYFFYEIPDFDCDILSKSCKFLSLVLMAVQGKTIFINHFQDTAGQDKTNKNYSVTVSVTFGRAKI